MTLKLKIGKKGYIILPKAIRDAVGIEEGDEVIVIVKDGIVLKPAKNKVDIEKLRRAFRDHVERISKIKDRREPRLGEAKEWFLEEEFEE